MGLDEEIKGLEPSHVRPGTTGSRVIIDYRSRNLAMLPVMRQELRSIGATSAKANLFLALLGIAVGILGTAIAALATGEINDTTAHAAFIGALIVSGFLVVCFGVLGWLAWGDYTQQIATIEKECETREVDLVRFSE